MKIEIYDIETLSNLFLYYGFAPKIGEENVFIIHSSQNDFRAFIKYLKTQDLGHIGYNNLNFDAQVLQWMMDNEYELSKLDGDTLARKIYTYSQYVISKQNNNEFVDYPEWKLDIPQLDLFRIWHYDNRAKATGLKWVQFSIDWPNLQEMPIEHTEEVKASQINDILFYCKNDVMSTNEFYHITMGKTHHTLYKDINKVQLREDIEKQFGIKCKNFNDVKIGDEINKQGYLKLTGLKKEDLKKRRCPNNTFTYKDCIPEYVNFKTRELQDFYNKMKDVPVDLESKQEYPLVYYNTTYMIAKGGIHSADPKRVLKPLEDQVLRDADIGSQYPNGIRKRRLFPRHLGEEWLEAYVGNIYKRIEAKGEYKKTKNKRLKSIDECFKLSLNGGGFGKTGEVTSWQYDPFISMSVTIGNQFEILMLIEMLEIEGIHIVSANTDGIVCLFDKKKDKRYFEICEEWEKIVGNFELGKLEYTEYELLAQTSVNSYIAIKPGKEPISERVKTKNEFMTDFEIHKDKSSRVVPLALNEYFVNGIDPEKFIRSHRNIYDFCIGIKKRGDTHFESEVLVGSDLVSNKEQKTLRFYISNSGCRINKKHNSDGRVWQVIAGKWMKTIFNKYEAKPWEEYDVNYNYYIEKTKNIIESIEKKSELLNKQLELF